jgi:hypothetical protein
MKKQSKALIITGMLFFLAGGLSWFLFAIILTSYAHLAVPVAAGLAAVGGFMLILNAVLNPESIKVPQVEVKIPEIKINLPHDKNRGS